MSDVRIEMTAPGFGRVWVDGAEVQGITALKLETSAGISKLSLELQPTTIEFSGPADVAQLTKAEVDRHA